MSLEDDYYVQHMSSKEGRQFIVDHHYSHGSHNGPTCFGLYETLTTRLVGVCAFATPCSEAVRASLFGPEMKSSVTELHRLVLLDEVPHNAESFFISRALRGLLERKPGIRAVISFADGSEGHVGTIYQATNAIYAGTTGTATFFRDASGRLRHPRQNGVNISTADARERGWAPEKRAAKHRYIFLLPGGGLSRKRLLKLLRYDPQPYPKAGYEMSEVA